MNDRPRVGQRQTPKVFPRAHTPSPAARQRANAARVAVVPGATGATVDAGGDL